MKHFRTLLSKVNHITMLASISSMPQTVLLFPALSPFVLSSLPTDKAASRRTANSHKHLQTYRTTRDMSLSPYLLHDSKAMDDQGTWEPLTVSTDGSLAPNQKRYRNATTAPPRNYRAPTSWRVPWGSQAQILQFQVKRSHLEKPVHLSIPMAM
jgi:hypothetical protein